MARRTETSFQNTSNGERGSMPATHSLTPREREVLELIGKGKTTKEIAEILNLSAGTVGNHRKGICRKLDTHSTAELVYRAAVAGRS
jgi:DNA-binding CsgD family transcriptional regulator